MSTQGSPLGQEVRFRIPLPVVVPFGALLLIAAVTIGISRILLSVPAEVAVIIALAISLNVMGACAYIASRPQEARNSWAELLIVVTYPILIGVVLANLGLGEGAATAQEPAKGGAPVAAAGAIVAEGIAFSTDKLTVPADDPKIEFTNNDPPATQHNIGVYDKQGGKELFEGDVIPGGQTATYDLSGLKPGEYYFQCDIHPGMNGTLTIE
jgi:plastocyanin